MSHHHPTNEDAELWQRIERHPHGKLFAYHLWITTRCMAARDAQVMYHRTSTPHATPLTFDTH